MAVRIDMHEPASSNRRGEEIGNGPQLRLLRAQRGAHPAELIWKREGRGRGWLEHQPVV